MEANRSSSALEYDDTDSVIIDKDDDTDSLFICIFCLASRTHTLECPNSPAFIHNKPTSVTPRGMVVVKNGHSDGSDSSSNSSSSDEAESKSDPHVNSHNLNAEPMCASAASSSASMSANHQSWDAWTTHNTIPLPVAMLFRAMGVRMETASVCKVLGVPATSTDCVEMFEADPSQPPVADPFAQDAREYAHDKAHASDGGSTLLPFQPRTQTAKFKPLMMLESLSDQRKRLSNESDTDHYAHHMQNLTAANLRILNIVSSQTRAFDNKMIETREADLASLDAAHESDLASLDAAHETDVDIAIVEYMDHAAADLRSLRAELAATHEAELWQVRQSYARQLSDRLNVLTHTTHVLDDSHIYVAQLQRRLSEEKTKLTETQTDVGALRVRLNAAEAALTQERDVIKSLQRKVAFHTYDADVGRHHLLKAFVFLMFCFGAIIMLVMQAETATREIRACKTELADAQLLMKQARILKDLWHSGAVRNVFDAFDVAFNQVGPAATTTINIGNGDGVLAIPL